MVRPICLNLWDLVNVTERPYVTKKAFMVLHMDLYIQICNEQELCFPDLLIMVSSLLFLFYVRIIVHPPHSPLCFCFSRTVVWFKYGTWRRSGLIDCWFEKLYLDVMHNKVDWGEVIFSLRHCTSFFDCVYFSILLFVYHYLVINATPIWEPFECCSFRHGCPCFQNMWKIVSIPFGLLNFKDSECLP